MSVLDELREALQQVYADTEMFIDAKGTLDWRAVAYVEWVAVLSALDAFEAAHPGLVDLSAPCVKCGAPTDGIQRCPYCLSRSVQWHDDEYIGCAGCGEVYHDRGTAFRPENDAVSLCSACAKEAWHD